MRLHIDQRMDSPELNWACDRSEVLLNGAKVTGVICADEEKGEILRYVKPFRLVGDEPATETLHGEVKIVTPPMP